MPLTTATLALLLTTADPLIVREGLAIGPVLRRERAPFSLDPVLAWWVENDGKAPATGTSLRTPDGRTVTWTPVTAGEDGSFSGPALQGGYLAASVDSPEARPALLEVRGNGMVYVNGRPRVGDVYGYGYAKLPVALRAGRNDLLMTVANGRASIKVHPVESGWSVSTEDPTLPDLVVGEPQAPEASILVLNATEAWMDANVRARVGDSVGPARPAKVPPMTLRKVRVSLPGVTASDLAPVPFTVELLDRSGEARASAGFRLAVKHPRQPRSVTFVSEVDGSVQYYAVHPASEPGPGKALVLSLHGASVEASGQAGAYGAKPWAHVVCPTNRRPYGFNWEDQGRLDALEVLAHAQRTLATDPTRTYLTGHSMGGHGTWYLGFTDPDRWGAIAPAAGWVSVWSYAGAVEYPNPTPVERELRRAANLSDTLLLVRNALHFGVFVLHGDADETVPVTEAREMRRRLGEFHRDLDWHEQPGGGHWYDTTPEPGADCVDYRPLFDLFDRRRVRESGAVAHVEFTTVSPAVNGRCHWARVVRQARSLEPSRIDLTLSRPLPRLSGSTENVDRLEIDPAGLAPGVPLAVEIDGTALTVLPGLGPVRLERRDGTWAEATGMWAGKGPEAYGPFKDAFRHRMLFVVGTAGDAEEDAWNLSKAVYDAETWWYRGNGSVDVVLDTEFDEAAAAGRNVILYGHAGSNRAYPSLVGEGPVGVGAGEVRVGERVRRGDFGCLFVRPREGRLVAVVAATGPKSRRAVERVPLFAAGVHLPDYLVIDPSTASSGTRAVLEAGFFDGDWGLAGTTGT